MINAQFLLGQIGAQAAHKSAWRAETCQCPGVFGENHPDQRIDLFQHNLLRKDAAFRISDLATSRGLLESNYQCSIFTPMISLTHVQRILS